MSSSGRSSTASLPAIFLSWRMIEESIDSLASAASVLLVLALPDCLDCKPSAIMPASASMDAHRPGGSTKLRLIDAKLELTRLQFLLCLIPQNRCRSVVSLCFSIPAMFGNLGSSGNFLVTPPYPYVHPRSSHRVPPDP